MTATDGGTGDDDEIAGIEWCLTANDEDGAVEDDELAPSMRRRVAISNLRSASWSVILVWQASAVEMPASMMRSCAEIMELVDVDMLALSEETRELMFIERNEGVCVHTDE